MLWSQDAFFFKVKGLFLTSHRLKTQHLWEDAQKNTPRCDTTAKDKKK